ANPPNNPITTVGLTGTPIGPPERVCLTPNVPANCSPPATIYNYSHTGLAARWTDLTAVPLGECLFAKWIWGPGTSGTSSTSGEGEIFFEFSVTVPGPTAGGTMFIAVDDFASIVINNATAATVGSTLQLQVAQDAASHPTVIDISRFVHAGVNDFFIH